jgi:hypothetical protein
VDLHSWLAKIPALVALVCDWLKKAFQQEHYAGKGEREVMILADRDKLEIRIRSQWERKK